MLNVHERQVKRYVDRLIIAYTNVVKARAGQQHQQCTIEPPVNVISGNHHFQIYRSNSGPATINPPHDIGH